MKKILLKSLLLSLVAMMLMFCATSFSLAGDSKDIIPPPPEKAFASNSATGINVTWSTAEMVAGYKIYRSENGGEAVEIADVRDSRSNSFTDTGVVGGESYTYFVCSYNTHNESGLTGAAQLICVPCPKIIKLENVVEGKRLEWQASEGADGYVVYKSVSGKYKRIARIADPEMTEYVDKSVSVGGSNQYKIVAINGSEQSAASAKKGLPFMVAPKLKGVSNGGGSIKLEWQKSSGANEYVIYKKINGSAWSKVATVGGDKNSYVDKAVSGGAKYTYTVKAKNGNNLSGCYTGLTITYINAPVMKAAANKNDKIVVSWNKADGAAKYNVYRKTANTEWEKIGSVKTEKYADSSIKNGVKYFYSAASVTADGGESAKASKSVECFALKMPTNIKAACSRSGVKISWKNMGSADEYVVYRKDSKSGSWKKLGSVDGGKATFNDTSAKDGKTYYYTVKPIKGSVKGSFDKEGLRVVFALAPELMLAHSPNGVVLGWSKSELATGYKIERKTEGGEWKKVAEIKGKKNTEYVHKKPAFGKLNYYRITVLTDENVSLVSTAKTIYGIDPNKPMVALTYDDGPYTPVTTRILDTLEKYDARATFFVVGSRVNTYKDCIKRSFDMGCEIGNHTYNHTILTSVGAAKIKDEINATNKAVEKITGVAPVIVRTPGGAVNSTVRATVKFPMFNWSVDTLDWKNRNASSVVSAIKKDVRDGSIVLMHDLYGSTAAATETIVPWLVKEGYQLVTVSEMMAVKGIDAEAGKLYNNAY